MHPNSASESCRDDANREIAIEISFMHLPCVGMFYSRFVGWFFVDSLACLQWIHCSNPVQTVPRPIKTVGLFFNELAVKRSQPSWCKLNKTLKPAQPSRLDCVGTWLSLVEHSLGVRGVGSSNLPVPTIIRINDLEGLPSRGKL